MKGLTAIGCVPGPVAVAVFCCPEVQRTWDGQFDELGPVRRRGAVRRGDRSSGDTRGAVVAADGVQAQVQVGRDPCTGEDLTLVDVQLVSLHVTFGYFDASKAAGRPVCRGGLAVEQPGSGADGHDSR